MNPIWLCSSALILICAFGFGTSLECYSCRVFHGLTLDTACKTPIKCEGPSVCLSATFSLENASANRKLEKECKRIADLDKTEQFPGYKSNFGGNCYTCETDGCNRNGSTNSSGSTKNSGSAKKASLTLFLTFSMASLLWCVVTRS